MELRVRRQNIGRRLLLPLLAACCLSGCSGGAGALPPLHDLHLPGVTQIASVQTLPPRGSGAYANGGVIDQLVTYVSPPTPSASNQGRAAPFHVVFLRDDALVYDVASDGSVLRHLDVLSACFVSLTVTPDGRWLTCSDRTSIYSYGLAQVLAPSGPTPSPPQVAAPDGSVGHFAHLTWAPDSQHFAAEIGLARGCAIGIFSMSAARDQVSLIARLDFPDLATTTSAGVLCEVTGLTWSPDGGWLAFSAPDPSPSAVYALSLASVLPDGLPTPPAVRSVTVTPAQLVFLGTNYPWGPISWHKGPGGESVTVVDGSRDSDLRHRRIIDIDLGTRRQTTLLLVDEGEIDALSWTPDGQHLVFAQGQPFCPDCQLAYTPSHLYVYTPSAADNGAPTVTS
jgi:WD40 repeat protein